MPRSLPQLIICIALAWLSAAGFVSAAEPPVDFDRQVRPILFSRCVGCHGPGEAEAGLRLDSLPAATAELDSGRVAIVPRLAAQSELLRRVAATDPAERMPPDGEPLTPAEIETLDHWIAAGADWPLHWAYRPLVKPPPPPVSPQIAAWVRSPIDAFIAHKLVDQRLTPSPPADRRTWLRRVHFDLLGLPPTPEALDAFLNDEAPDAYERVVDALLANPQYGERWARHWMDIVHFAETHGHDQDRPREHAWPYRDYLIRSLNADKPYAQFVQEQVAGDVLNNDDPWAIVATGFLAAGPWDESSLRDIQADSLDRQIGHYLDRDDIIATTLSTFISTTVHCARCHDHKFDPVTQREYYNLQAVFAGTDKAERPYDPDPQVAQRRRELTAALAQLQQQHASSDPALLHASLQAEVAQWEKQWRATLASWRVLEPATFHSEQGSSLCKQADHSLLAGGKRPEKDTYIVQADSELPQITGFRLETLADESLPQLGPGRQDNGNFHLSEFAVTAEPLWTSATTDASAKPVSLASAHADFDQAGWTAAHAIDGNLATAWGIHPQVGRSHQVVFTLQEPLRGPVRLTFHLRQLHGQGHLIGRPRLSVTDAAAPLPASSLPQVVTAALAISPPQRSDQQRTELAAYLSEQRLQSELAGLPTEKLVYCGTNRFKPDGSFRPAVQPRPVYVLHRGDIDKPLDEVGPGALTLLAELPGSFDLQPPAEESARRAALARWLSDRRNVLTWRSIANRLWQFHFGRGIVDTPNDFGRMGSGPSHPELLDWLAVELRDSGGSLKSLHRQIVTSAAYRQGSPYDSPLVQRDAENRFLWRMNRRRLDAESIRDAALQFSGTLDRAMGGPSVKQFIQTPGVHVTPKVDYAGFDVDAAANYRRSVYRFLFRTLPDPLMESLDCPDGSQLTPQRSESVTVLHALSLLNDKSIIRLSEQIAQRVSARREVPGLESLSEKGAEVAAAFRLILCREPSAEEAVAVSQYAAEHGLANACRFLLNTNEFIFVD